MLQQLTYIYMFEYELTFKISGKKIQSNWKVYAINNFEEKCQILKLDKK